jgi:hypothetical protein
MDKHGDFPIRFLYVYQRVTSFLTATGCPAEQYSTNGMTQTRLTFLCQNMENNDPKFDVYDHNISQLSQSF